MMRFLLLVLALAATAAAQSPADPPLGLPGTQAQALLEGQGLGLARPAELSGFPGPLHVLELANELDLTEAQLETAQSLRADVLEEARALGARIVAAEHDLDALFADPTVDVHRLEAAAYEIARLRAELRLVHLRAHLSMNEALTREQTERYHALRHGIDAPPAHQH